MVSPKNKPKGYFDFLLAADCETTGLAYNSDDASIESDGKYYQSIAWGLVVADANTLLPVEKLYVEIKWDKKSIWSPQAEKVHGLSREYLEQNGIDSADAVVQIGGLILKYWGPTNSIRLLGHNVATFDMWFLKRLMRSEGIDLKFGNRHIDTSGAGFLTFNTYTSDELFAAVGLPERDAHKHNALDDALHSLHSARTIRLLWNKFVKPQL